MNDITLSSISLFSGVGMLDEGLRAGLRYLGISHRTVLHVEREAYGASVLAARMEEGSLDAAPIWSDVCTLDAKAWVGRVDIVVAGFPCQDLSVAGRRVGLDGKRSGLFFEVVRIATDCGAELIFLENVAGIASATASVMDETEGELDERAAARVVGELADLGWNSEWITLSAADVGASHGRARWFCLAWRMEHTRREQRESGHDQDQSGRSEESEPKENHRTAYPSVALADAAWDVGYRPLGESRLGRGVQQASDPMDDAKRTEWWSSRIGITRCEQGHDGGWEEENSGTGIADKVLGDPNQQRQQQSRVIYVAKSWKRERADISRSGREFFGNVANASGARYQGALRSGGATENGRQITPGSTGECRSLFAPGPSHDGWAGIIARFPWLAPALSTEQELDATADFPAPEPLFRGVVDGLAGGLDFGHRASRLKCGGNGVVPLCAATAFVILARRAGILKEFI